MLLTKPPSFVYALGSRINERGLCMYLHDLRVGDQAELHDGSIVIVVAQTEDDQWIKVRYQRCPASPSLVGSEDLCHITEFRETRLSASQQ